MNQLQIAQSFSLGQFSQVFEFFSEHMIWDIVGQKRLVGIQAIQQHCLEIETYLHHTEHQFRLEKVIQHQNFCMIQGTAHFITNNSKLEIKACDLYTFIETRCIISIESYCIPLAAQN